MYYAKCKLHKRVYNVTCHNVIYIIDYLSHLINMVTVTTETQEDCGFCDNQRVKILCQKGITLMLCRYSCLITVELGPCLCMRLTMDLIVQKMIVAIYLHAFVLQSNALKRNIYDKYHVYLYQDSVWLDLVHPLELRRHSCYNVAFLEITIFRISATIRSGSDKY